MNMLALLRPLRTREKPRRLLPALAMALSAGCVCKLASAETVGATNRSVAFMTPASQPSSNGALSIVIHALQQISYPKGSVIRYADQRLDMGVTVKPQGPGYSKRAGIVLEKQGYLILIDEKPNYRWEHDAKVVFVEADQLSSPSVVFTNIPSVSCVDSTGVRVTLQWKILNSQEVK